MRIVLKSHECDSLLEDHRRRMMNPRAEVHLPEGALTSRRTLAASVECSQRVVAIGCPLGPCRPRRRWANAALSRSPPAQSKGGLALAAASANAGSRW